MRYTEQQVSSELLDQPRFTGEPRKIVICSTPRSGSYMLCRYMINAGLGVPHEYFNPIIMRQIAPRFGLADAVRPLQWRRPSPWDRLPFGKAARAAEVDFLKRYVDAVVPRRCQGGVLAVKIHFDQYLKVLDNPVGWSLLEGCLFIHLVRDDLLAQAVSTHFAKLTGRWGIDDAVTTAPAVRPDFFNPGSVDRIIRELADQNRGWQVFLARNGISPISVSYEKLCEDPFGFVVALAERVGVDPDTLRRGYSEARAPEERGDPGIPSKSEVARRYVASVGQFRGAKIWAARVPAISEPVGI